MFAERVGFRKKPFEIGEHFTINGLNTVYVITERFKGADLNRTCVKECMFKKLWLNTYPVEFREYVNFLLIKGEVVAYSFKEVLTLKMHGVGSI